MGIKISEKRQEEIRNNYLTEISKLLLGPGSEKITLDEHEEIISEKPESRYVTGILYPIKDKKMKIKEAEVEDINYHGGIDKEEESTNVDNSFLPSSMGMTFYCSAKIENLSVEIKTAWYESVKNPYIETTEEVLKVINNKISDGSIIDSHKIFIIDWENMRIKIDDSNLKAGEMVSLIRKFEKVFDSRSEQSAYHVVRKLGNINFKNKSCYKRKPVEFSVEIDLSQNDIFKKNLSINGKDGIQIFSKKQKLKNQTDESIYAITIVIKNVSEKHFFQSEMKINKQPNLEFRASEDINSPDLEKLNYEDAMNFFLYREKKTFGFGRGVAVVWEEGIEGKSILNEIKTSYIPTHDLMPMSFNLNGIDEKILKPESYVNTEIKDLKMLKQLVQNYEEWINNLEIRAENLNQIYQKYAKDNINKCWQCHSRMLKTISFLEHDTNALKAFSTANEAILLQRIDILDDKRRYFKEQDYSEAAFTWRPFQLAFILYSLESILNQNSDDREILDLIWVSTGGGKTEAYLFAIAAAITYRRLEYPKDSAGVSVIMRYTLRLLTAQQFERASQLIVALEYIRKERKELGLDEISIGLWIGEGTKNKLQDAKENFNEMVNKARNQGLDQALKINSFQVLECPWCHEKQSIIPLNGSGSKWQWGYDMIDRKEKYNIRCKNKKCDFSKGLPIFVVDESIYDVRPTLLFGTVDKFAQVPLKEESQRLFGSDDPNKYRRPELIIQDELHLISGPLGSIVGLYEAGFDYIMRDSKNGAPPKYIASTATIRNAEEQVNNIFNRKLFQFPPDGLISSDNFFVKENQTKLGRKYVGIMSTGKSQLTAEIRLLSSMLQVITELGLSVEEEELYWTITGYFNSIRELGKAAGLIKDDVKEYIRQLHERNHTNERKMNDESNVELTSRIPGSEIPEVLSKIDIRHTNNLKNKSVDTLIATNMLSVGVDIGRLNSMFVAGQPKLTSEYIQATSRVGREDLGIVFTLYNSSRSRDRSHYETFQSYHQSLYKFVESSSVTPYSIPALSRGIAAVIVAMLRNTVQDLSENRSAIKIEKSREILYSIEDYFKQRSRASEDEYRLYSEDTSIIISEFISKWLELVEYSENNKEDLMYYLHKSQSDDYANNLLLKDFQDKSHSKAVKVLGSMRNVENVSYLNIIN